MDDTGVPDPDPPTNLLVEESGGGSEGREICGDLLTVADPDEENVLGVTCQDTPREWVSAWRDAVGQPPDTGTLVVVGEDVAVPDGGADPDAPPLSVERVEHPGDLTTIGMRVGESFEEWAGNGNRTVLCFHSVSTLLAHTDVERVFRFLNTLTGQLSALGGVGHYHLDPEPFDEQDIATLRMLFDDVVRHGDGGWTCSME